MCYLFTVEVSLCHSCRQPKGVLACGLCNRTLCKRCVELVERNSFSFLEQIPEELSHRAYCSPCFSEKVVPALASYNRIMARAKAVIVFLKDKGEETRRMKRTEKPLRIADCDDRKETLLRLAFLAAKGNFNALIDVDIFSKKVRNFGYQTSKWHGIGIPTQVDADKLQDE
jgi:hypothetical protein